MSHFGHKFMNMRYVYVYTCNWSNHFFPYFLFCWFYLALGQHWIKCIVQEISFIGNVDRSYLDIRKTRPIQSPPYLCLKVAPALLQFQFKSYTETSVYPQHNNDFQTLYALSEVLLHHPYLHFS